jgi:hypothetical protein
MTRPWLDQTPAFAVTRIPPTGGLAPGTVLLIWFPSIDQLLPPKAAIPHFPLLMIAQFATRQLLPLQPMAAKPTVGGV